MKKTLGILILFVVILTIIVASRMLCIPKPGTQKRQIQIWPKLPSVDQLGKPVTFEMTYNGNLKALSSYDSDSKLGPNASFVKDVLSTIKNKYVITQCPYFEPDCRQNIITEYKDEVALAVYFDLDANGKLSQKERLETITVLDNGIRDYDAYEFVTPDFTRIGEDGTKIPFRIQVRAAFINPPTPPLITVVPLGRYEGTAKIGTQELRLSLFGSLDSRSYLKFGQNSYAMTAPSQPIDQWRDIFPFSSLITHNDLFYRVAIEGSDRVNGSLKIRLYEDKTPRGKLAFSIRGKEVIEHCLTDAAFRGSKDTTILFTISLLNVKELPEGNYVISSGTISYGKANADEYYASFRNTPAFTIHKNNPAAVEIGMPEMKLQVTELNGDKQYKTQFTEGTDVLIEALFTGMAGETYRAFHKWIKNENNTQTETLLAHIKIFDDQGNEIVNHDMNYT